jgi:hypothetical protein
MKTIFLVAIVIAASSVRAEDTKPACGGKTLFWHISAEKSRDSSLNDDYRLIQEEGLNRVVKGLIGWTAALDTETKSNVATLCEVIKSQQVQLDELKNQVESLRKQMAQVSRPTHRATTAQTTK